MDLTPIELDEIDQYWNAATHDGDEKLIQQGIFYLASKVNSHIQLDEFYSLLADRYEVTLPLKAQIQWLVSEHLGQEIHLGKALALLASRHVEVKHIENPDSGLRFLAALLTEDPNELITLSSDPCVLVRCAVVASDLLNSYPPQSEKVVNLLINDPYQLVRDVISELLEVETVPSTELWEDFKSEYSRSLEGKDCPCNPAAAIEFVDRFQSITEFALPVVDGELLDRVRDNSPYFWATQPFPVAIDDYLMDSIIEYLQSSIPDQFAISHAGHGINSYSLNYRYALGSIAILAQVSWGGAYGDIEEDGAEWMRVLEEIDSITEMNPAAYSDGFKQRDYLILLSRFRGICTRSQENDSSPTEVPIVFKRAGNNWSEVPGLRSWDDIRDFFRSKWFAPDA